jgi:hypothetical protein
VHPLQSEPVDYVYARATLLCTLFSLLAIESWMLDRRWISVAWFAAAVLAKEECVTVPLMVGLYTFREGELKRRWAPLAAMLGVAALAGVRVMAAVQITGMKNIGGNAGISPLQYLSEQGLAIMRYVELFFVPWRFSVDPSIPVPDWWCRGLVWLVLLAAIAATTLRLKTWKPAFWILAGFILLIPSSTVFPVADLAADRRMYLPMLAFAPAVALMFPGWRTRAWVPILCVLAILSIGRTYVWASDERLWGEAVQRAPAKIRPRIQLSRAVPPEQALSILQDAKRLAPQDPALATELARVYLELQRPAEALSEAGRALALTPGEPHAINNRGTVLLALHQSAAARRDFLAALKIDPCLREARANLERSGGIPAEVGRCTSE